MSDPQAKFNLDALRYESLAERPSKVTLADLGQPGDGPDSFQGWLDRLPSVLAADAVKQLRDAILMARSHRVTSLPLWAVT